MLKKPGYSQLSNEFVDDYLRNVTGSAAKVFLVITRKTIGYHKLVDAIAGSQIATIAGLDRETVIGALQELERQQLVTVDRQEGQVSRYTLNIDLLEKPTGTPDTSGKSQQVPPENPTGTCWENQHTKDKGLKDTFKDKDTTPALLDPAPIEQSEDLDSPETPAEGALLNGLIQLYRRTSRVLLKPKKAGIWHPLVPMARDAFRVTLARGIPADFIAVKIQALAEHEPWVITKAAEQDWKPEQKRRAARIEADKDRQQDLAAELAEKRLKITSGLYQHATPEKKAAFLKQWGYRDEKI